MTIRLGSTPSGLSSAHLHDPPIFYRPDALHAAQPTVSNTEGLLSCSCGFSFPSVHRHCWRLIGSALVSINEVTLHRARLVLGWVAICRRINHLGLYNQPLRPTQPSTLSGMENEYRPKCSDALRLGSKGRYGSFQLWINM